MNFAARKTGLLPSANNLPVAAMRLVAIANHPSRRSQLLLSAAARRFPRLKIQIAPWIDLLDGKEDLRRVVKAGDAVRIESPGKHFEVERMLLLAGLDSMEGLPTPTRRQIERLSFDRGRILWPDLWYRGFAATLSKLERQLSQCPAHSLFNQPRDIRVMFDKTATSELLQQHRIPVAPALGPVRSFDDLVACMREKCWNQVFVKLASGSSASGTIALRTSGSRMQAYTTVEFDGRDSDGGLKLYNTRKIRALDSIHEIAATVDALCAHGVHVERWLPKAGIDGKTFDVRLLVIGGRARHIVVRLSRTPMTNLNLLNDRDNAERVKARCPQQEWDRAIAECELAMQAFPGSLYAGIDLMFSPGFRKHAILEVNAFGDLLPGAQSSGMDTYEAELAAKFGCPLSVPEVA